MSPAQSRMVWSLGIAQCISWGILFYAFSVLLPPMAGSLPMSHSSISFMATLSALVAAAISIPLGKRLDLGGHLRIMMGGSLLGVLGCLLWSWSASPVGLYSAALLIGVAQASTLYEPAFVFLMHVLPDERDRNPALLRVTLLGGLASTFFLPLTAFTIEKVGWRAAIQVLTLFLFIPVLIYGYWDRKPISNTDKVTSFSTPQISNSPALNGSLRKILFLLVPVFLINGIVHTTMTTHLPSALQNWGTGALEASWAVGLMGASQLLGRIGLGAYLKLVKGGSLLFPPFAILAGALLLLPFSGKLPVSWLLLCVIGMFSGLLTLLRPILVSRLFEVRVFGRVNGILALIYQLARAGGPVGGAWVFEVTKGYHAVFWCLASMLLLAAFLSKQLPIQKQAASTNVT